MGHSPFQAAADPRALEEHLAGVPGPPRCSEGDGRVRLGEEPPGGEGRPSRSGLDPAIAHAIESVRGRPASLRRGDPTGDDEAFTVGEDARAEAACRSRA